LHVNIKIESLVLYIDIKQRWLSKTAPSLVNEVQKVIMLKLLLWLKKYYNLYF